MKVNLASKRSIVAMSEMTMGQIGMIMDSDSRYSGRPVVCCDKGFVMLLDEPDGWQDGCDMDVMLLIKGDTLTIE